MGWAASNQVNNLHATTLNTTVLVWLCCNVAVPAAAGVVGAGELALAGAPHTEEDIDDVALVRQAVQARQHAVRVQHPHSRKRRGQSVHRR